MNVLFLLALNQSETLWADPAGADAPEVDRELARDRHDRFLSGRAGGESAFAQEVAPFHDRAVLGLEADQAPGGLDQGGSEPRVVRLRRITQPWARVWPLEYSPGHNPV